MSLDNRAKAALTKSLNSIRALKKRVQLLEKLLEDERITHYQEIKKLKHTHKQELEATVQKQLGKKSIDTTPVISSKKYVSTNASILGVQDYSFGVGETSSDEELFSEKPKSTNATLLGVQDYSLGVEDSTSEKQKIAENPVACDKYIRKGPPTSDSKLQVGKGLDTSSSEEEEEEEEKNSHQKIQGEAVTDLTSSEEEQEEKNSHQKIQGEAVTALTSSEEEENFRIISEIRPVKDDGPNRDDEDDAFQSTMSSNEEEDEEEEEAEEEEDGIVNERIATSPHVVLNRLQKSEVRSLSAHRKQWNHARKQLHANLSKRHAGDEELATKMKLQLIDEQRERLEVRNTFAAHAQKWVSVLVRLTLATVALQVDRICSLGPHSSGSNDWAELFATIKTTTEEVSETISLVRVFWWRNNLVKVIASELVSWLQYRLTRSVGIPLSSALSKTVSEPAKAVLKATLTGTGGQYLLGANIVTSCGDSPISASELQTWRLQIALSTFLNVVTESEVLVVRHTSVVDQSQSISFADEVLSVMSDRVTLCGTIALTCPIEERRYWMSSEAKAKATSKSAKQKRQRGCGGLKRKYGTNGEDDDDNEEINEEELQTILEVEDRNEVEDGKEDEELKWPNGSISFNVNVIARLVLGMAYSKLIQTIGVPRWGEKTKSSTCPECLRYPCSGCAGSHLRVCLQKALKAALPKLPSTPTETTAEILPLAEARGMCEGWPEAWEKVSDWLVLSSGMIRSCIGESDHIAQYLAQIWPSNSLSNQTLNEIIENVSVRIRSFEIETKIGDCDFAEADMLVNLLVCLAASPVGRLQCRRLLNQLLDGGTAEANLMIIAALCEAEWIVALKAQHPPHHALTSILKRLTNEELPTFSRTFIQTLQVFQETSKCISSAARMCAKLLMHETPIGQIGFEVKKVVQSSVTCLDCWVINLDKRVDRWHRVLTQIHKINRNSTQSFRSSQKNEFQKIVFSRSSAVDGGESVRLDEVSESWDSTLNAQYDAKCLKVTNMNLSSSERGCAGSHLQLWKRHLKSGQERQVIFEDDAKFSPQLLEGLQVLWNVLDKIEASSIPWDIVFIGYFAPQKLNSKSKKLKRNYLDESRNVPIFEVVDRQLESVVDKAHQSKSTKHKDLDPIHPRPYMTTVKSGCFLHSPDYIWGLHGYVLRRSGASKLIKSLPIDAPADVFISSLIQNGTLNALALSKPLVMQDRDLGSDISHSGMLRKAKNTSR